MKGILEKARVMSVSALFPLAMVLISSVLYAQGSGFQPEQVEFKELIDTSSLFTGVTPVIAKFLAGCLIIGFGVLLVMKFKGYFWRTT